MHKLRDRKVKVLARYVITFVLAIVVFTLFSEGYGQAVNFREYKPTLLPPGISTTNGEFYVLHNKGLLPSFDKHINVYLNIPNSWLTEWKSDSHLTNPCSDLPDETDCHTYVTPNHQTYQLSGGAISNSHFAYDLRFIKGGTEVWLTIAELKQDTPVSTWSSVVDSFQSGHYSGLKVIHGSSSGP